MMAKRLLHNAVDTIERKIFLGGDLDATARGWRVGRPRPFVRTYRDERWPRLVDHEDALCRSTRSRAITICRPRGPGGSP